MTDDRLDFHQIDNKSNILTNDRILLIVPLLPYLVDINVSMSEPIRFVPVPEGLHRGTCKLETCNLCICTKL